MAGYCFMGIEKIKTKGNLTRVYQHNYRIENVQNADKELEYLNEELISLNGQTYNDALTSKLRTLGITPRKNAVLALEIVTQISREDMEKIDLEKWKKDQVEWLTENFNKCPEKYGNNVVSIMYHGDEAGGAHCHAVVIPIDEKGHLNASSYLDGKVTMRNLQTSYGKKMEKYGLKRGLVGSHAKHQDVKKFYAQMNKQLEKGAPEIQTKNGRKETIEEYKKRVDEIIKDLNLRIFQIEKEKERAVAEARTFDMYDKIEIAKNKNKIETIEREFGNIEEAKQLIEAGKTFLGLQDAFSDYPDEIYAQKTYEGLTKILTHAQNKKKKQKQKKENIENK